MYTLFSLPHQNKHKHEKKNNLMSSEGGMQHFICRIYLFIFIFVLPYFSLLVANSHYLLKLGSFNFPFGRDINSSLNPYSFCVSTFLCISITNAVTLLSMPLSLSQFLCHLVMTYCENLWVLACQKCHGAEVLEIPWPKSNIGTGISNLKCTTQSLRFQVTQIVSCSLATMYGLPSFLSFTSLQTY